jgi:Ca2+-transporting ATPase
LVDTNKQVDQKFVPLRQHFFNTLYLASNAEINPPDEKHPLRYAIGDPTEAALMSLAQKVGIDTSKLYITYHEEHQFGFDSIRKMMSSVRTIDNQKLLYVK